jgi:transposase-like zinc-binding protein
MSRPKLEVADIFRRHGAVWRAVNRAHLSLAQRRVMTAIEVCRTAALGGHIERCEDCAHTRIAYNSCRNRHCPKCQWPAAQAWMAAREAELLPASPRQLRKHTRSQGPFLRRHYPASMVI